jgi:hypothetical protein
VTSAIDRKELRSHEGPHRKHQITVKDALAWVEKRKAMGFLNHRTLTDVWHLRQGRS